MNKFLDTRLAIIVALVLGIAIRIYAAGSSRVPNILLVCTGVFMLLVCILFARDTLKGNIFIGSDDISKKDKTTAP